MPSPRNPLVPRFAPENSITLVSALDIFGRAVDPAWTGEEIKADTAPEPTDEHLCNVAFARVTQEAARGEIGDDHPTEQQILDALHMDRDMKFAARRRWKSAALELRGYLHQGKLAAATMGIDGRIYAVPVYLWASDHAEDLFDNGGQIAVSDGQLAVPRGLIQTDTATLLVNRDDLQRLITAINEGSIPALAPEVKADPYRTGLPGKPSIRHLFLAELRRRVAAGEFNPTISAEAKALHEWASSAHSEAPTPTEKAIENLIRPLYNALVRRTK